MWVDGVGNGGYVLPLFTPLLESKSAPEEISSGFKYLKSLSNLFEALAIFLTPETRLKVTVAN